jgi:hypothetical protein
MFSIWSQYKQQKIYLELLTDSGEKLNRLMAGQRQIPPK